MKKRKLTPADCDRWETPPGMIKNISEPTDEQKRIVKEINDEIVAENLRWNKTHADLIVRVKEIKPDAERVMETGNAYIFDNGEYYKDGYLYYEDNPVIILKKTNQPISVDEYNSIEYENECECELIGVYAVKDQ